MKNTLLFICSTNILVRLLTVNTKNCLTPKNPKMCYPILATLLKMRPHYSQPSRENATPSSGMSPLASYKEVLPPELVMLYHFFLSFFGAPNFYSLPPFHFQSQDCSNPSSRKLSNFHFEKNIENQTVPCESIAGKVSYEWSHFGVSSKDSKV